MIVRQAIVVCIMGMIFLVGFYSTRWLPRKWLGVVVGASWAALLAAMSELVK